MADNLNSWFDPLMLDVAMDKIKPIILDLFQQEAQAISKLAVENAVSIGLHPVEQVEWFCRKFLEYGPPDQSVLDAAF